MVAGLTDKANVHSRAQGCAFRLPDFLTSGLPDHYPPSTLATAGKNLKLKFWGVRGSIPCPGPDKVKFGGNTSCLQVIGGSDVIILDAGTGIRELGLQLAALRKPLRIHLLLTHTHWDHIQGFPFFTPIYIPGHEIFVYGPRALEKSLEEAVMAQMQYSYFPVKGVELSSKIVFRELDEEDFRLGDVEFRSKSMNHPIRVLAFRFARGASVGVYTGDNEPYYDVLADTNRAADSGIHNRQQFIKECNDRVVQFVKDSSLLIADAQYTDKEYEQKRGWGHSSVSHVLDLAVGGEVGKLALFHHEPTHDDATLAAIERDARALAKKRSKKIEVFSAREGETVDV